MAHPVNEGYTLVELVLVMILISILGAAAVTYVQSNADASRYEAARTQLDAIRTAILGDMAPNQSGHRANFGYVGDFGALPASLSNLTGSQTPAWSFNSTYGIGAGWRGPYLSGSLTGSSMTNDPWGNALIWAPSGSPPSITSYGNDGAAGGSGFATDIVVQLPTTLWQAAVYGKVLDGTNPRSGASVQIVYPVSGTLTAFTTTTASDGSFSFSGVPFGVRSIGVTSAPVINYKLITVDSPSYQVQPDVLNSYAQAATPGPTLSYLEADLWHDEDMVLNGSPIATAVDTNSLYNFNAAQTPSANSDSFQQTFVLNSGNYTFYVLGQAEKYAGMIDWYIDGVKVVSGQDWYNNNTAENVIKSAAVAISTSGVHTLKGVVNGMNSSSHGYDIKLTKVWFR